MIDLAGAMELVEQGLERCSNPYIAFSGGKDSLVVAHLVHSVAPDTQMVYCDDELLYPEHVDYIRQVKNTVGDRLRLVSGGGLHRGWFRPWLRGVDWWRQPYPDMEWLPYTSQQRGELALLALHLGYDGAFLGLRRHESIRRAGILAASAGIDHLRGYWHINPIIDWTDTDVWEYIDAHDLAYCLVYDRLSAIGVNKHHARLGPLPLSVGKDLWRGWPGMYAALLRRYGRRWTVPSSRRCPPGVSRSDWLNIQSALATAGH